MAKRYSTEWKRKISETMSIKTSALWKEGRLKGHPVKKSTAMKISETFRKKRLSVYSSDRGDKKFSCYYLILDGIRENKCEECQIGPEYNGKILSFELDHIDGNPNNHKLSNLRILCPNCHSQTPTYKSKNKKLRRLQREAGLV